MVHTFTGGRPPRNEMDEQDDTHVSEPGLNDFRPMPRNLFVGGAEQDHLSETDDDERTPTGYATQPEQFQVPTGTRSRPSRPYNSQRERPERSTEPARTTELEERTRILEMAMGKILARLIPDDPLIPLLNRDAQLATMVATRNSPALSNVVVLTRPRGSGKLNNEPSSSKHSEELMRKNADLERQLRDVQKSIDELKSPRSHQQTLDLDNAPLNLSITAEPYQEGFKIPHLETYDGSGDPDEHLHTYQAIMRIQNANDAMMCKVFPATLKSTARRWYHKLPRHSIDSYSQLAKLFSNKFASQREIKRTATELMQVNQREGESLRDYMQRFNKATLDIDNVPDTICLSALLHGLKRGRFLDDLLENPPRTWNEVNDRSASFILSEDFQSSKRRADDKQSKSQEQPPRREEKKKQKVGEQWGKPADFPKYANYIPLTLPRSQILAQIQHWVRRPPPPLHDSPRADKSKHCDYHRVYGHNTEDCQHLKDELEFLARNGKLEGYVQKPHAQQPTQTHFVQGYDRPQGQRYQLGGAQNVYQDSQYPPDQGRAYRGRPFNRRGQVQRAVAQNQKDKKGVGYAGIPPPSGTINMISGGVHSRGQNARARKAYARQVMTVNKNRPLKQPFEEAEWENTPITFSPADYKRAEGELDIMMPHADPFVATVHISNHNVNKVFIDTGSSLDILYWSCFQKMQLNPSSLQKHEGPIYGFDNQPIPVEGVITLPIYVGSEPRFRMASVTFLWDFRLPLVKSINVSGHKYGLVYAGVGWVIWRNKEDLPEELVFHINYLGSDQPTFTLNFSKGSSQIIAQYYQFIRLGFKGYKNIIGNCMENARVLREGLEKTGRFDILSKEVGVPLVAFALKDSTKYTVFQIADNLRRFGWIIPAYTMAPDAQHIAVLRIVIREDFSRALAERLISHVEEVLKEMDTLAAKTAETTATVDAAQRGKPAKKSEREIQEEVTQYWKRFVDRRRTGVC
ncbi:hypothetical protein SLEP1_g17330 [Rubroshorea leprosula]|uniref:glutamate decarboxylase n=1 Tax=Rubroshorea leprosula TaxID=152421 RepID=A0AAV5ITZ2_9ROSI|nr:hypothetical protein SLEP1_g17330 [Rubroshorea leprosula]